MLKILAVEDDIGIRDMLKDMLEQDDFSVQTASDTQKAMVSLQREVPDLILLDWMLPGQSGIEWAKRLKKETSYASIPIMMLTARGEVDDKVRSLDIGIDDHITKPFSNRELIARIKAVLRRCGKNQSSDKIELGGITLLPDQHRITITGVPVTISPTEFRLLEFLLSHPERVYSRAQLLDQVWGRHTFIEERTVDVHIRRLRKLLSEFDRENLIQTVRGFGYRCSANY
ncbi:MAG: phosphate regulon transcriptional regulatory protein PhoB [Gammaproteobacteria bacterium]|nr:phosphate regulon transcriptional regulatory protein PhoB [Gammaproteobacteria bacterium]NBT45505.1 phosphate regulon transcriptional regulatory protein PhoB [Gammaproteobacteria bacterium]NBY21833.1 phosphate regulon transcriptional regulatory protein PhoB [Gammaproteobacteria bacterium]NDE34003.1 phosphate regulon transcriptional regulatory protein PhoB [Gammaproteobacteria bacterium]NDE55905.1 phosphate regulon transcriptional regulatory protein PhoB [Gammaproteobacteria bacterium]